MRTVGKRSIRPISIRASGALLSQGAKFNDEIHYLPTGNTTYFPKGVYRYKTHDEASRHWDECMINGIAEHAR